MNEVARVGGLVNDDHLKPRFISTSYYPNHVADQNFDHRLKQRNSIDDADDARLKYTNRHSFKAITPNYVSREHDFGPFTLLCDDFRSSHFLLDDDLNLWWIDLEWTYAAPYQMLYSPPRWLLLRNPCRWSESPGPIESFKLKFEIFHLILVEEESKRTMLAKTYIEPCEEGILELKPDHHTTIQESMSSLMRRSMEDGKFWYHELVRESFDLDYNFLWEQISKSSTLRSSDVEIPQDELDFFVAAKMAELHQYEATYEAMEARGGGAKEAK